MWKKLEARKMLLEAADSQKSAARCVGHRLADSLTAAVNPHAHHKPSCDVQARQTSNLKNKAIPKTGGQRTTTKTESICPEPKPSGEKDCLHRQPVDIPKKRRLAKQLT